MDEVEFLRAKLEEVTRERDELLARVRELEGRDDVREAVTVWFEEGFY